MKIQSLRSKLANLGESIYNRTRSLDNLQERPRTETKEHIQLDSLCLDNLQERPRTETKTHFFDLFEIQEVMEISQDI